MKDCLRWLLSEIANGVVGAVVAAVLASIVTWTRFRRRKLSIGIENVGCSGDDCQKQIFIKNIGAFIERDIEIYVEASVSNRDDDYARPWVFQVESHRLNPSSHDYHDEQSKRFRTTYFTGKIGWLDKNEYVLIVFLSKYYIENLHIVVTSADTVSTYDSPTDRIPLVASDRLVGEHAPTPLNHEE